MRASWSAWIWRVVLALLLAGYLSWLRPSLAPFAGSADVSGYLFSARLFLQGTLAVPIAVPQGFPVDALGTQALAALGTDVRPGTRSLVPTYPTGLPLHLALAALFAPEERATRGVLLLVALGALLLMYRVGREAGLARPWAVAGGAALALSPLFLFLAVQPLSDVLATLWAQAVVFFAWRARRWRRYALLAGAAIGMATLVRPTNLVMIVPLVAALPSTRRQYAGVALGGLPFAAFLLAYQAWAYGHPLRSGYGDVSSAFSLALVGPTLGHYATWLPQLASWLIVLAPAAWWAWRGPLAAWRRIAAAWLGAVLGLYAGYVHTSETWWYLRFALPAFPALLVATMAGAQYLVGLAIRPLPSRARSWTSAVAALAAVGVVAAGYVRVPEFKTFRAVAVTERTYKEALEYLEVARLRSGPVLAVQMSGAVNYYAPDLRLVRFDRLSPGSWGALRAWQQGAGVPIVAAVFPFEQDELFPRAGPILPCEWRPRGHYRHITFWECPP